MSGDRVGMAGVPSSEAGRGSGPRVASLLERAELGSRRDATPPASRGAPWRQSDPAPPARPRPSTSGPRPAPPPPRVRRAPPDFRREQRELAFLGPRLPGPCGSRCAGESRPGPPLQRLGRGSGRTPRAQVSDCRGAGRGGAGSGTAGTPGGRAGPRRDGRAAGARPGVPIQRPASPRSPSAGAAEAQRGGCPRAPPAGRRDVGRCR